MLKDAGEKVSAAERQTVESAIQDLRAAIEKNDVEAMKRHMETLNTAQHRVAEAMYKAAQAPGATDPGPQGGAEASGSAASGSGDVIDAEVVEDK